MAIEALANSIDLLVGRGVYVDPDTAVTVLHDGGRDVPPPVVEALARRRARTPAHEEGTT